MGERDQSRRQKANRNARAGMAARNDRRQRSRSRAREERRTEADRQRSERGGGIPPPPARSVFDVQSAPVQRSGRPVRSDGMQQIILPVGTVAVGERTSENAHHRKKRRLSLKEQRRRRRRRRAMLFFLLVGIMLLGFFLSVNVLFKVSAYRIEDTAKNDPPDTGLYTEDAIIAALNVPLGSNLFGFQLDAKAAAMEKSLPYIEHVVLRRKLPGTIVVQVQPAVARYRVEGDFGWAELSTELKVLSVQHDRPSGGIDLALPIETPVTGAHLTFSAEYAAAVQDDFYKLVALLEKESLLNGVTRIDMTDLQEITFTYEDRVLVRLGTANSLDYKLRLCGVILRNDDGNCLSESDRGTLDASYIKKDGTIEPVFRSENDLDITASMAPPAAEPTEEKPAA